MVPLGQDCAHGRPAGCVQPLFTGLLYAALDFALPGIVRGQHKFEALGLVGGNGGVHLLQAAQVLGADFQITEDVSLGAEVNANMLPDHFNSKLGKHDNKDWLFNAMVGIRFTIGKDHGRTEPTYQTVHKPVEPKEPQFVDVPVEKISFNVNIYFVINQSVIRTNQMAKLRSLIHYLNEHPKAFVRLSGYADKDTGTPEINMRLSVERSQVVSQFLQNAGIEEWRIRRFAKGDRVQPFDIPEDNRVCICYVYDPENPVPQKFEY